MNLATEAPSGVQPPEGALPHTTAAERNLGPLREQLRRRLPTSGLLLEVASGTGFHAAQLAPWFPGLTWLPSEPDAQRRSSVEAWRAHVGAANLREVRDLDTRQEPWPVRGPIDAVLVVNLTHIAPWEATLGLLRGAGEALGGEGVLLIYGAFLVDGQATPASNRAFDESLRSRDSTWGLRDIDAVDAAAREHGLHVVERQAMPAHNWLLELRRSPTS